jgi:hypothetical protein
MGETLRAGKLSRPNRGHVKKIVRCQLNDFRTPVEKLRKDMTTAPRFISYHQTENSPSLFFACFFETKKRPIQGY